MVVTGNVQLRIREVLHHGYETLEVLLGPYLSDREEEGLLSVLDAFGLLGLDALQIRDAIVDDRSHVSVRLHQLGQLVAYIARDASDLMRILDAMTYLQNMAQAMQATLFVKKIEVVHGQ